MFIRIIIIFLFMLSNSIAEEISGIPKVVDGDTIHINNYKFRLEGIDAPEMRQQCKKEFFKISFLIGFTFYKDYSCGKISKASDACRWPARYPVGEPARLAHVQGRFGREG